MIDGEYILKGDPGGAGRYTFFIRVFDVVKIWPARRVEEWSGGLGITADDVVAGIQTNIFVQIVILVAERFA